MYKEAVLLIAWSWLNLAAAAETLPAGSSPAGSFSLADPSGGNGLDCFAPSSGQVGIAASADLSAPGITVTLQPGADAYPGLTLTPGKGAPSWDLSAYGHVEARVVNTGSDRLHLVLRIDNPGDWQDNPWNSETCNLDPGETGTIRVVFGNSFGKPGYPLKSATVNRALLFAGKSDAVQSFRIESIEAGGHAGEKTAETAPVDPNAIRLKPRNGILFGPGGSPDASLRPLYGNGSAETADPQGTAIVFPPAKDDSRVAFNPAAGYWDLSDFLEVRVKIRNLGSQPVTLHLSLASKGGFSDVVAIPPVAPGETAEGVIPFAARAPWHSLLGEGDRPPGPPQPGTGTSFTSNTVSGVIVEVPPSAVAETIRVESIVAEMPPLPNLPAWLGTRPPIEGNWVETFDEEFDGQKLDASRWNLYGPNWYDPKSHFSKENVIVENGDARLRFEKKRGYQNDNAPESDGGPRDPRDPLDGKANDYATGYLNTHGKWVQRYGYFESRMKLPSAPGLWPAFWMMPDRGPSVSRGERESTADGGMEFDILEYLSGWGPYRYNIAMHWDGYEKDHKQTGSDKIYFQPDKDGFVTAGLLWLPGLAVYYANGREVLRCETSRISSVPSYFLFTMPSGGWDNTPLDDARLPGDFVIGYVRAWQRADLASDADTAKAVSAGR